MQFKKKANVFATLTLVASSLCSSFVGVASAETKSGGQPGYEVTNLSPDFRLQVTGPNGYKAPVYCYDPDFEAPSLGGKPVRYERFDFYDGMKTVANRKGSKEKVDTVMTALLLGYPNNLMGDKLTSVAQSDMNQGLGGFNNTHTLNDYMWSSTQQAVWAIAQPGGGHERNNYIKDIVAFAKKYPLNEDTAKAKYAMIVDSKNQVISNQNPLVVNPTTHKSQAFMLHKNYQLPVQIKDLPQNLSILDAKGKKTTTLIPGVSYYVQGSKDFSGKIDFKANFFKIKDDNFFAPLDSTGSVAIPYQNVVNTSYEVVPVSIPVTGSKVDQKTTVEISKQDVAGKEIAGAKLAILDTNGKEVTSWTSNTTSHKVTLSDGKYTLKETQAPEGYEIAESIPFEVKDGKVVGSATNEIVMIDKLKEVTPTPQKQKVILSKQNVAGKEIAGSQLTLTTNGQEVDSWISEEGKDHEFLATPNQEYTLQEVQAPKGYKLAESITFRVNEEGKVET